MYIKQLGKCKENYGLTSKFSLETTLDYYIFTFRCCFLSLLILIDWGLYKRRLLKLNPIMTHIGPLLCQIDKKTKLLSKLRRSIMLCFKHVIWQYGLSSYIDDRRTGITHQWTFWLNVNKNIYKTVFGYSRFTRGWF